MVTINKLEDIFRKVPFVNLLSVEEIEENLHLRTEFYFAQEVNSEIMTINKLIKIIIPKNYPDSLPIVHEFGTKTIINYPHLNPNKLKTFCLGTEIDLRIKLEPHYNFENFLEIIAWYLVDETFYSQTGTYIDGDRSHFQEGVWETYLELFSLNDRRALYVLCRYFLSSSNKLNNQTCFCGSMKKFKYCHQNIVKRVLNNTRLRRTFINDMNTLGVIKNGTK